MVDWSNVFYGVGFLVVFFIFWGAVIQPVLLPMAQSLLKMVKFDASAGVSKKEGYHVNSCGPYPR